MTWHLYSRGSATGIFLQNVPFFPTNLPAADRSDLDAIWNISIISLTQIASKQLEFTVDGGVTFFPLNQGVPIRVGDERIFNIKATTNELFNLRCTGGSGCDIYRCLVSIAPEDIQRPIADIEVKVADPLPVDICPVTCPIDVNILNQPIAVITSPSPLPVDICPVTCDVPIINGSVTPLVVTFAPPPIGVPVGQTIFNLTDSAITANTDISGSDLSPSGTSVGNAVIFRVEWSSSSVGVLSMTLDGITFVELNNGTNLRAESIHLFDVVVDHADLFNLQFNKNTTIRFLRIVQLV